MRIRTHKLLAVVSLASALLLPAAFPRTHSSATNVAAAAPRQRSAINTYAITNARVVTVSGPTIERGTVVFRDGLIVAVGANAAVPPDARTIDGAGLTIYPGLVDALTTHGIPRPTPAATPAAGGGFFALAQAAAQSNAPSATSPNSTQPPGLQPEILASDIIRPGGDGIESARNAGITAALTAPRGQIFAGQSAFINLSGDTPQQMIVRSPVALHVGFTPLGGFGGPYPTSLMGVFSAIRQMFYDARRSREANQIYERAPRGLRRPEQDKSLAALAPALAREMPVVMQAEREREILRALDLAQEFNLRLVVAGGADSWKVADRLKASDVPVLLSLNFPRRTSPASPDADPEPTRLLRERAEAPKAAARLAQAGVRFAFQSGGLANMSDFLANAAKAVEQGLARDEAIRAMTIRPAEIFGVADRLGTIEVGKIANLTVTRGDIFAKERKITHVFIDGRPVDLRPAATTAAAGASSNVSGTWNLNVNTGGVGETQFAVTLMLQQQGERVTGSIQGPLGSAQIANASLGAGGEIRFTVPVQLAGQTAEASFSGNVSGNEMRGTIEIVGRGGPGTFTGTRAAGAPAPATGTTATPPGGGTTTPTTAPGGTISGTWNLVFALGPRDINATLELRQQGASVAGTMRSELGSSEVGGTANAEGFSLTTTVQLNGSVEINLVGTVSGNGMSGTANTPRGAVPFTGTRPQ